MSGIARSLEYMSIPEESSLFKWNGTELRNCSDCVNYEECICDNGLEWTIPDEGEIATACANFTPDFENR